MDRKEHWEKVYSTKQAHEVSWTQELPSTSLDLIQSFQLPMDAAIIDVGGGDSHLVDHLLKLGYSNITVLDISEAALHRAQNRLGPDASKVKWVVSNILDFQPQHKYDLWHDRAVFHFLTDSAAINIYVSLVKKVACNSMVMATFSKDGPEKCSGLPIQQYDESTLKTLFLPEFELLNSFQEDHITPFNSRQSFLHASLNRSQS